MIRKLWNKLTRREAQSWREVLPVQSERRFEISGLNLGHAEEFSNYLRSIGADFAEGNRMIYMPPTTVGRSAFRILKQDYPPDAGLKIRKREKAKERSDRQSNLVANLLFVRGLGPRLYDRVFLKCGQQEWEAFVIQHVEGCEPSASESAIGLGQVRVLEDQGLIHPPVSDGNGASGFARQSQALISKETGKFQYLAFQDFELRDYAQFLERLALQAMPDTHFGNLNRRGQRYLYQSIPGVPLQSKRSVENRMNTLSELMASVGVAVKERLVLDVGCNIGMMMAQYLKAGARWCHGWDLERVTQHTEQILLALGCTRFSTTGGKIRNDQALEENLPNFLRPALKGCVVSYLAIRGHVGWLDALGRIPWAFMIYEGHKPDTEADFKTHTEQLRRLANFTIGPVRAYRDGKSRPRLMTILKREEHLS